MFIAHAGADSPLAEELYTELVNLGVSCFLDAKSLLLGDDWDLALPKAQRESTATVVLVSDKCDAAFYQREEIAAAIALSRADTSAHQVIPIYVVEPHVMSIPYGLRVKHGLYLTQESTWRDVATKLAEAVRAFKARTLRPFKGLTYDVDLCMCLDLSNSLGWLVKLMKRQLLTLGYDVVNDLIDQGKPVDRLRVSLVTFGPPGVPIERTPMIELPSGAAMLYERALSLRLAGGGPPVSTGLDALRLALESDWSPGAAKRRHIVALWTDRAAGSADQGLNVLEERWEEMDAAAKRLVLFAPDEPGWRAIGDAWENCLWFPVSAGRGLTEVDQAEILRTIIQSV